MTDLTHEVNEINSFRNNFTKAYNWILGKQET